MKYAIAAAAMATAAVALPQDWAPVSTTTSAWSEVPTTTSAANTWGDNTWSVVESSTTTPAWTGYTTPAANTWSAVESSCTSTWTTSVCGASGDWNNCNVETSTTTLYGSSCSWEGYGSATSTWAAAPVAVTTWASAPVKVCTYVTVYDKTYTTQSCGTNSGAWDNCKEVTATSACTETVTDAYCTGTWSAYTAPAASTWSAAPVAPAKGSSWSAAPVAASSTWAPAPVAATSSVWAPVGKYTGAADKQAIGFGAAAIAAVAMML